MKAPILSATIVAAMLCSGEAALAAGPAFDIEKKPNISLGDVTDIIITSREDVIMVGEITVNRGNCNLRGAGGPPSKMKFGYRLTIQATGFCKPLEIQIQTDKGLFQARWDR